MKKIHNEQHTPLDINKHLWAAALMAEYRKAANCMLSKKFKSVQEAETASNKFLSKELRTKIEQKLGDTLKSTDFDKWLCFKTLPYNSRLKLESILLSKLSKIKNIEKRFDDDFNKIDKLGSNVFLRQFEAQAEYYAEKPAIRYKDTFLSYKEANDYANQIAHCLREKYEIKKGDVVGVFLPHDEKWIPAILAIWKIGAAFVAIDSKLPTGSVKSKFAYMEKFNHLLEDVNNIEGHPFKCVISTAQDQSRIPKNNLCLDDDAEEISHQPITNIPDIEIDPDDLAYIMYTSGSSGRPKGVLLNHKGLSPCLEAHRECVDLTSSDKMAQYAAISFDAWLAEVLVLGIGAQLVIVPSEYRLDLDKLTDYYNDCEVNMCILTPAVLKHLPGPQAFPKLKALFVVGEKFTVELAKEWLTKYLQVVNGYGLVETHIAATLENLDLDNIKKLLTYLSIGKAIIGTDIHILKYDEGKDRHLGFVKDKNEKNRTEKGELFISGISLADKYTKFSDDENTKRFKYLDPKSGKLHDDEHENTIRVYRTGDKGYFLNDNDKRIVVTGRYGRVVKFAGKRVHLDGLEENIMLALNKFPIRDIAIDLIENKKGKALLVFYILNDTQKKHPDNKDIKETIENNLGDRANNEQVTAILYPRSDFHPTPNGKKDYKTLKQYYLNIKSDIIPQQHESTSVLDKCWRDITGTQEKIQPFDSFRDHGGSSLSTMLLLNKLRSKYPKIAPYLTTRLLLEHTTFQKQQQLITNLSDPIELEPLPTDKRDIKKFGDEKYTVFCIHSILGDPILDYDKFSGYFPKEFQLIGIKARGHVDIDTMPQTIDSIATDYCVAILQYRHSYDIKGPVTIVGHSSGGNIAIEIARQLKNQGEPVPAMPFLIDSTSPALYQKLSKDELCHELIIHGKLLYKTIKLPRHKKPFSLTIDNLKEKQTMKEKIDHLFDTLDTLCGDAPDNKKIIRTARRIRLAEQIYVPQSALPPYYLYVAEKQDLSDCTPLNQKTLDWPKHSRRNPKQSIFNTNHLGIVCKELANILQNDIASEYRTFKVPTVDQIQTNNITPTAKIRLKKDLLFDHSTSSIYVIPRVARVTFSGLSKKSTYLTSELVDFLKNPKLSLLLIQAVSGMGKSSTAEIINEILNQNKIPTYFQRLSTKSAKKWRGALKKKLKKWDKDSPEIRVLILDAYNEMSKYRDIALYRDNKLSKWKNLKVVITCTSEHLSKIDKGVFHPNDRAAFQEIKILPYSQQQQHEIIKDFIEQQESYPFSPNEGMDRIHANQSLAKLSENLMFLKFILSALPKINPSTNDRITLYELIKIIVDDFFDRSAKKLEESKSGLSNVKEFKLKCKRLCQDIAIVFWIDDNRYSYSSTSKNSPKKLETLFSKDNLKYIEASPIHYSQSDNTEFTEMNYGFEHGIFQEFFAIQGIIKVLSHPKDQPNTILKILKNFGISASKLFTRENMVKLWLQAYRTTPGLGEKLYNYVFLTRTHEELADLGAIAITLLHWGGEVFNGLDLSNIRIPCANLMGAYFDSTNLQGADLTNVNFSKAWLRNANLQNTKLLDVSFGNEHYFSFPTKPFKHADYRTEGNQLFTANGKYVYLWDIETNTTIKIFAVQKGITDFAINADCSRVVTCALNTVMVWDMVSPRPQPIDIISLDAKYVQLSANGEAVLLFNQQGDCEIFDLANKQSKKLETNEQQHCFSISENAKVLAAITNSYWITVWNIPSKQSVTLTGNHHINNIDLSADGMRIAAACDDGIITVWDQISKEVIYLQRDEQDLQNISISADGRKVATTDSYTGEEYSRVIVWDIDNQKSVVFNENVEYVELSADGHTLILFNNDTLKLWDLESALYAIPLIHENVVNDIQICTNGKTAVTCSIDSVQVWDTKFGQTFMLTDYPTIRLPGWDGDYSCTTLSLSANGKTVAIPIAAYHRTEVWDIDSGKKFEITTPDPMRTFRDLSLEQDQHVCLTSEGNILFSLEQEEWELDKWQIIKWDLTKHQHTVMSEFNPSHHFRICDYLNLHLSEDNNTLAVVSAYELRVWNLIDGNVIALKGGIRSEITNSHMTSDGKTIVTCHDSHAETIWDLSNKEWTFVAIPKMQSTNTSCTLTSNKKVLITSNEYGHLDFYNITEVGRFNLTNSIHLKSPINTISVNDHNGLLMVGLMDGTVQCWQRNNNTGSDQEIWKLKWSSQHPNTTLNLHGCDVRGSEDLSQNYSSLLMEHSVIEDDNIDNSSTENSDNPSGFFHTKNKPNQSQDESSTESSTEESPRLQKKVLPYYQPLNFLSDDSSEDDLDSEGRQKPLFAPSNFIL